ncbi:MAG: hypothetical protein Q9174_006533 [Haloplaca sp. 1 TL-2023]
MFNPFPEGQRSKFVEMFQFVGTTDISPYLCMEEALKFRRDICGGEERIMEYCENVSNEGAQKAADILGTEVMENEDKTLTKCCMTNVRLPLKLGDGPGEIKQVDAFPAVAWMAKTLIDKHDMFVPPYFHGGAFWARFSGQVYVESEDFVLAAKVLKDLCEQAKRAKEKARQPSVAGRILHHAADGAENLRWLHQIEMVYLLLRIRAMLGDLSLHNGGTGQESDPSEPVGSAV